MNDYPQIECKIHAFRKTQDGVVISFVLHPDDVPNELMIAPLGTRYMMVLVELNDNETAKPPASHKLSQQAGIYCNDPAFRRYLWERPEVDHDTMPTEEEAAAIVRELCGVESRSEFDIDPEAGRAWRSIKAEYDGWKTL